MLMFTFVWASGGNATALVAQFDVHVTDGWASKAQLGAHVRPIVGLPLAADKNVTLIVKKIKNISTYGVFLSYSSRSRKLLFQNL